MLTIQGLATVAKSTKHETERIYIMTHSKNLDSYCVQGIDAKTRETVDAFVNQDLRKVLNDIDNACAGYLVTWHIAPRVVPIR